MDFPENCSFKKIESSHIPPRATGHDFCGFRFSHRNASFSWSHLNSPQKSCLQEFGSKDQGMFNRFAVVLAGLMLTLSSVGCCCLHGSGYGAGYGMRNSCPPCNNGCAPMGGGGTYYQPAQGAFLPGIDSSQTAYSSQSFSQTAFSPTPAAYAPISAASMPISTATVPGAIQGPPIVQGSTLPLY